jgi:response regulator RpfG family c-di-GMP phosphodiesterase
MDNKNLNVLVVDNDKKTQELIKADLEHLPIVIFNASIGEEGIKILKNNPEFPVIISDYNLGSGMTGGDFFKLVGEYSPNTSRILMADGIDEASFKNMMSHGFIEEYVMKPVVCKSLVAHVEKGLGLYKEKIEWQKTG